MSMGYHDYGGGPVPDSMHGSSDDDMGDMSDMEGMDHSAMGHDEVSVADLTGPSGRPDVAVTLTAREETVDLAGEGDRSLDGITLNHQSPGPVITARAGDLVEVTLVNESVDSGITLHWHGVDVPNAEDGVAGVTQDAVQQGDDYVYRFVVEGPGHLLVPLAPGLRTSRSPRGSSDPWSCCPRTPPTVSSRARRRGHACTPTTGTGPSTAWSAPTGSRPRPVTRARARDQHRRRPAAHLGDRRVVRRAVRRRPRPQRTA